MNAQVYSNDKLSAFRNNISNVFGGNVQTSSTSSGLGTASTSDDDQETTFSDVEGKVKTRLLSMWNNMKYGWASKIKTNFSKESPVWLLGRCYHRKSDSPSLSRSSTELGMDVAISAGSAGNIDHLEEDADGIEDFKIDFVSRLWLTYRREFPILNGSTFTSDCGWGCMLRSGQMMLAQALLCHFLGRSWRWFPDQMISTARDFSDDNYHRMIIKWFGDKPSYNSPLSIHTLVTLGESSGKRPGDWYGPASVAHILRQAVKLASKENSEFDDLVVYISQDCAIYIQDVLDECLVVKKNSPIPTKWKALILLVPVRLGTEKLNPIYAPCLTALLSHENCIGIIGGRPKHSLYFIGYQDDKLIHLDPHYCQEMVDVWAPGFPLTSFHCRSPRKMHLSKMDPSCCIGFYCQTEQDFYKFIRNIKPYLIPPSTVPSFAETSSTCAASTSNSSRNHSGVEYPLFVICEGRSSDANKPPLSSRFSTFTTEYTSYNSSNQSYDNEVESEEFEIL